MHFIFFFNDSATTEIYTLSLHDALPIFADDFRYVEELRISVRHRSATRCSGARCLAGMAYVGHATTLKRWTKSHSNTARTDRKSTRLNSSQLGISCAVFFFEKKKPIRTV